MRHFNKDLEGTSPTWCPLGEVSSSVWALLNNDNVSSSTSSICVPPQGPLSVSLLPASSYQARGETSWYWAVLWRLVCPWYCCCTREKQQSHYNQQAWSTSGSTAEGVVLNRRSRRFSPNYCSFNKFLLLLHRCPDLSSQANNATMSYQQWDHRHCPPSAEGAQLRQRSAVAAWVLVVVKNSPRSFASPSWIWIVLPKTWRYYKQWAWRRWCRKGRSSFNREASGSTSYMSVFTGTRYWTPNCFQCLFHRCKCVNAWAEEYRSGWISIWMCDKCFV